MRFTGFTVCYFCRQFLFIVLVAEVLPKIHCGNSGEGHTGLAAGAFLLVYAWSEPGTRPL
jgi:hypothetical protein